MKATGTIILAAAAMSLAACATPQQSQVMRWVPTGTAAIPEQQALAECRYDIVKDRSNFDQLFLLSGQPAITPSGHVQGLSSHGQGMFQLCMSARGYNLAGSTPYVAGVKP
jgi:uncharacterized lipoprotein YajG